MGSFQFAPRWQDLVPLLDKDPGEFAGTMEDRERQLEEYLDYAEDTYTPELSSTGTPPTIGDAGFEFGLFSIQGRMCDVHVSIQFGGAGITAGTGVYLILLPVRPRFFVQAGLNVAMSIGSGQVADASDPSPFFMANCEIYSPTSTTQFYVNLEGGGQWTASNPGAPANNDHLRVHLRYMVDELA